MKTRVQIFVGTGGVGKTTTAVAAGFSLASEGKKVLVITIDPSLRLKDLLGLSESGEVTPVSLGLSKDFASEFKDFEVNTKGALFGAVLNSKKVFDEFVMKCAKNPGQAEKLLKNKLYQKLSTSLAGSQEFTALEFLLSHYEKGEYDVVILDTPPSHHVLDFLRAPQKLSQIFQDRIAKWFKVPTQKAGLFGRVLSSGSRKALSILESLTGSEFIHQLADFFDSVDDWREQIDSRIQATHQLLVSKDTEFSLVLNLDRAKAQEGLLFAREIQKNGYRLKNIIINRAVPYWQKSADYSKELSEAPLSVRQFYEAEGKDFSEKKAKLHQILDQSILNQTSLAKPGERFVTIEIPEIRMSKSKPIDSEVSASVSSMEELWQISQCLRKSF